MPAALEEAVFINCPFDDEYHALFRASVFAVYDAGFVPRCALEVSDATQNRLDKILQIIAVCRYGIHDISRTELDRAHGLPRFNMPLELGLFLACKHFGGKAQRLKSCLILDREPFRYQKFISDIAGQDIFHHDNDPKRAIRRVRDWLRTESKRASIPGGDVIVSRYFRFQKQLPAICKTSDLEAHALTFADLIHVIAEWLTQNAR